MAKKRLFIGTYIDKSLISEVYSEIQEDFSAVCAGKWVELENLHFTYHFLGDVDEEFIPDFIRDMKHQLRRYKSPLTLQHFGVFPDKWNLRVLYVSVDNIDGYVYNAHKQTAKALMRYGFKPDKRKYHPHATLLRIKDAKMPEFQTVLDKYKNFKLGVMPEFSIHLIESKLTNQGPIYTILK